MIPYGKQQITQQDIDAVVETLQSDYLTQGPKVSEFEQALAQYTQAQYCCVTNSATSALHIACLALGINNESIVWTTPNTYVASANCALYCGATIDFVDIDPTSYNISPISLKDKLKACKESNSPLPNVVIPVHFSGLPCDMEEIHELSLEYGFSIIEDASHAIGSHYNNKKMGNCYYSDITIFSFHPVKIMTCGEGGAALTNSATLFEQLKLLSSHGVTRDPKLTIKQNKPPWYYEQIDLGFNYRMTDIQATLGLSQLKRLNSALYKRKEIAQQYDEYLAALPIKLPTHVPNRQSSWHLYTIQIDGINYNRDIIFNHLRKLGIGVNVHYIPVHTQPFYQNLGFNWGDFPNAEHYFHQIISLPIYPDLTHEQQLQVVNALKESLEKGKK